MPGSFLGSKGGSASSNTSDRLEASNTHKPGVCRQDGSFTLLQSCHSLCLPCHTLTSVSERAAHPYTVLAKSLGQLQDHPSLFLVKEMLHLGARPAVRQGARRSHGAHGSSCSDGRGAQAKGTPSRRRSVRCQQQGLMQVMSGRDINKFLEHIQLF